MQPVEIEPISPAELVIKLHFMAYRAASNKITDMALSVFEHIRPSLSFGIGVARKMTLFDFCYTSTLKVINCFSRTLSDGELYTQEEVKTLGQVQREQEIAVLRVQLGKETIFPKFSEVTAEFIHIAIPSLIAEKLSILPAVTEKWAFYQWGLPFRYINHQLKRKTGYRDSFLESKTGKALQDNYCGLRTRLSYALLGKESLLPLINFEHILLNIFSYVNDLPVDNDSTEGIALAIQSVGESLSYQTKIDRYIKKLNLQSDKEAFIARLEWHRKNKSLPKGIPDPRELTTDNFTEKLDEAMYERIGEHLRAALDRLPFDDLKKGLVGLVYYLEGKDLLVKAFSHLLIEFGIKQLIDPHLLAMAILYSYGVEVADYELDGFGRGTRDNIIETGIEMMRSPSSETIQLFENSGLKAQTGGMERIDQQREVKKKLKELISSLLYEQFKKKDFRHKGLVKTVRKEATKVPVVGMATNTLHLLINGTIFSLGYLMREKKHGETSFQSWMFQHFSGHEFYDMVADKIVELIYHPSWRITAMQLLETLADHYLYENKKDVNEITMESFKKITDFLIRHFINGSSLPKKNNITKLFSSMVKKEGFAWFKEFLKPSKQPPLEKGLEAVVPSIKEYTLQNRILDAFRMENVHFEGDAKFWEIFIREALNRLVEDKFGNEEATLEEKASVRESFVSQLLSLELPELRETLSQIPNNRVKVSNKNFNLMELIKEDYTKNE